MHVSLHSRSGSVANVYPSKCRDPHYYQEARYDPRRGADSSSTTRSSQRRPSSCSVTNRDMPKNLSYHLEKYTSKRGLYLISENRIASSRFVQDEYEIMVDVVPSADGLSSSVRFKSIMWSCDSTSTKMFRNALILNSEERVTQGCMLGLESSKNEVMSFDLSLAMHHPLVAVERDGIVMLITNFLKIAKAVTSKLKEPNRQASVSTNKKEIRQQPHRRHSTRSLPPRPVTSFKWKPSSPPPPPSFDEYSNATPIISNRRGYGRRISVDEESSVGSQVRLQSSQQGPISKWKSVSRPNPHTHQWPQTEQQDQKQQQPKLEKQKGLLHHLSRMSSVVVNRFRTGSG